MKRPWVKLVNGNEVNDRGYVITDHVFNYILHLPNGDVLTFLTKIGAKEYADSKKGKI